MNIIKVKKINKVPGLYYIKNFIDENDNIFKELDNNNWTPVSKYDNSRVVQQYGYLYNYTNHKSSIKTNEMLPILNNIKNNIEDICNELKLINNDFKFNQCIVNNYIDNQKISKHIDAPSFDKIICCLSIGDTAVIRFKLNDITHDINIENNSLYIMSGDARYKWTHEMLSNKSSNSYRRISITYRKVLL